MLLLRPAAAVPKEELETSFSALVLVVLSNGLFEESAFVVEGAARGAAAGMPKPWVTFAEEDAEDSHKDALGDSHESS